MSIKESDLGHLLKISSSYWETCALHVAVKLDLFTHVGDKSMTGVHIANTIGGNKDGLLRLLDVLCAMKLMIKNSDKYSNSKISRLYLCRNSKQYIGFIIKHHHNLFKWWASLYSIIKDDSDKNSDLDRVCEEREAFIMGMHNLSMITAPKVAKLIDFSKTEQLLDLGGGPGTYTIHFCKYNPRLKGTIFDLETTRPFAEELIKEAGLTERISFLSGNFLDDSIGDNYDVIWLSHVLHSLTLLDCKKIIIKASKALKPGGRIIIQEFILNENMDASLFPALFSLNMLITTVGGRSYSRIQLEEVLKEAGFKDIKILNFEGNNGSKILTGSKHT